MRPDEIERLRAGGWELDCYRIVLRQRTAADPEVYSGPGWVRQLHDGEFAYKILVAEGLRANRLLTHKLPAGTVIPDEAYFDLCATDEMGRQWKAERIRPKSISSGLTHSVVEGVLSRLVSVSETVAHNAHAKILFAEKAEFPCTTGTETKTTINGRLRASSQKTNAAEFTSCGHRFLLLMENGALWLEIDPESELLLAPSIETRTVEALQFVLARPMPWVLLEKEERDVCWTEVRPRTTTRLLRWFPPIWFSRVAGAAAVWQLCDRYLQHIIHHPGEEWHPLSERIYSVLQASNASVEAHALTLGVQIEGILKSELGKTGEPKRRSAADRLHSLANKGLITADLVPAWRKLRNSSAHADSKDTIALQEFSDLLISVTSLLHQLVFAAIGYRGPFAYHKRGPQSSGRL